MNEPTYLLQQGIVNPRDGAVGFQDFEGYPTKAEAMAQARKHKGLWQIVECKVVWQSSELKELAG